MKYTKTAIAAVAATLIGTTALIAAPGEGRVKADADGNGVITKSEAMTAADARFAKMDVNSDGVLNAADREAKAKQHFAKMDANGDGAVTEAEFLAAREARMEQRKERRAAMGERRGKGKMRRGGRGKLKAMMKRADTNGDQAISKAEFTAAAEARFAKVDANGDGSITKEERRDARKKMRGKWRDRNAG